VVPAVGLNGALVEEPALLSGSYCCGGVPLLAYLTAQIRCPNCTRKVLEYVTFQWGYCRGYRAVPEASYCVGDEVRWRACSDGSVPAWSFFGAGDGHVGDPAFKDLTVRDYWLEDTTHSCGQDLGGAAVEVRNGVITRAWAYRPGDLDNSSYFYARNSDGTLTPMHAWDNHAMAWVDLAQCGHEVRFTVPVSDDR
jgi:hypothetical protein